MKAKIRTEKMAEYFPIRTGVPIRQRDPLRHKLFRQLEWNEYCINVNGVLLNHHRFADDVY